MQVGLKVGLVVAALAGAGVASQVHTQQGIRDEAVLSFQPGHEYLAMASGNRCAIMPRANTADAMAETQDWDARGTRTFNLDSAAKPDWQPANGQVRLQTAEPYEASFLDRDWRTADDSPLSIGGLSNLEAQIMCNTSAGHDGRVVLMDGNPWLSLAPTYEWQKPIPLL